MKKSPIMPKITLQVKNGKSFCDSLDVAKYFHKRHDHVLRDIDKILDDFNRAGHPKFGESNFILDTYINKQNIFLCRKLRTHTGEICLFCVFFVVP